MLFRHCPGRPRSHRRDRIRPSLRVRRRLNEEWLAPPAHNEAGARAARVHCEEWYYTPRIAEDQPDDDTADGCSEQRRSTATKAAVDPDYSGPLHPSGLHTRPQPSPLPTVRIEKVRGSIPSVTENPQVDGLGMHASPVCESLLLPHMPMSERWSRPSVVIGEGTLSRCLSREPAVARRWTHRP